MKLTPIIHQQIMQLKWHFLACFGLVMALPIEEAIINLNDRKGFYATVLSLVWSVTVSPLLAGLIACADVQADLDDRRYIFWRSKPVGVKTFMTIKYIVGLLIAFAAIVSPLSFAYISSAFADAEKLQMGFTIFAINCLLISLASYSVCFFCNVLVRKTARAWLIGMAMVLFLLLVPFILPLSFKDMTSDFIFAASVVYISVTLIPALIAFIASLVAASRNWHLQTNLKGLLWTGAGLIFLLMLLFTRQVANIKVLDEVEIDQEHAYYGSLEMVGDSIRLGSTFEIAADKQQIHLVKSFSSPSQALRKQTQEAQPLYTTEIDQFFEPHSTVSYRFGAQTYTFNLNTYYIREKTGKNSWTPKYKEAYLCSYQLAEDIHKIPVAALSMSDYIDEQRLFTAAIRQVDDKLIVFIQDSFAVVQIKQNGELELIDKQINGLKGYSKHILSHDKIFTIPLIHIPQISIKERIKLTIDLNYWYNHSHGHWRNAMMFYNRTLVDINGDAIIFCLLNEEEISRFDVVKWDDEYIYCKLRDARPFTYLEQIFGLIAESDHWFVQDGKLYAYEIRKLMVFDVRSDRIRKLGHYERLSEDYSIQDIEVLRNGNILLSAETEKRIRTKSTAGDRKYDDYFIRKGYLSLLKNPE